MKWKQLLPFTDLFSRRFAYIDFELAGLLAHLTFAAFPLRRIAKVAEIANSILRLTAAGTAPASNRIPFSDKLPKREAHQPSRHKSRENK